VAPKIYAVGSSTMAGLAFVMRKSLKKRGARFESGAKPSTGLARPDFFDWPAQIPKIVESFDPDVFIVSLGTNDGQAMRLSDRSWVRASEDRWSKIYRERVRKMLSGMNAGRARRIIWIGPNALGRRKAGSRRDRINAMMRDEIEKFEGDAHFIDLYHLATDDAGRIKRFVTRKSDGRHFLARAKDGVHLSLPGLRYILAERVYGHLKDCFSPSDEPAAAQGAKQAAP
jgi:hypothetical protein